MTTKTNLKLNRKAYYTHTCEINTHELTVLCIESVKLEKYEVWGYITIVAEMLELGFIDTDSGEFYKNDIPQTYKRDIDQGCADDNISRELFNDYFPMIKDVNWTKNTDFNTDTKRNTRLEW